MPTYEIYKRWYTRKGRRTKELLLKNLLICIYLKKAKPRTIEMCWRRTEPEAEERRRRTPLTIGEQIGEGIKGVGSGAVNILESGALGLASIIPESKELVA